MFRIGFWWVVAAVLVGIALAGDLGLTDTAGQFLLTTMLPVAAIGCAVHLVVLRVRKERRRPR